MQTVTLNANTPSTIRPTTLSKEAQWKGRKVEPLSSDSNCLTQKGLRFSDRVAPPLTPDAKPFQNSVIYFDVHLQEPEWRFADPAPYIPKNYEENLTVEELLERTGYKFATSDELQIIECKKVKDRITGWWKSGVKWAKEHKKELIIAGVILGTGALTVGAVLLISTATAEAAVATGAAAGAAAAASSGSKKKEEEDKPQPPKEVASASPPPPPFIPIINSQLPASEKPQPAKEPAAPIPAFTPPIDFHSSTSNKPHPKGTPLEPPAFIPPVNPFLYQNQIQTQAKTYTDYLIQHAINPLTPLPSLPALPASMGKPEEQLYSSMFQTIQNGFSYMSAGLVNHLDNPEKHGIPSSIAWSMPPLLSVAPLKSAYHDYLSILANHDVGHPLSLPPETDPPRSLYFTIEGIKHTSTQISNANGMGNSFKEAQANAKYLQSFTSLQIEGIYNHSNGPVIDILEIASLNLAGYSPNTEALIMKKFIDFAEANKNDPYAKCLHPCHSQGAIHTRNALEKLPQEIRDRVIIVNIAGARVIPKRLCFRSYNFVSKRDLVPHAQFAYKGFLMANLSDEEQQEIFQQEKLDAQEIIALEPHKDATGLDHSFQSPTYAGKIKEILQDYEKRLGRYE